MFIELRDGTILNLTCVKSIPPISEVDSSVAIFMNDGSYFQVTPSDGRRIRNILQFSIKKDTWEWMKNHEASEPR